MSRTAARSETSIDLGKIYVIRANTRRRKTSGYAWEFAPNIRIGSGKDLGTTQDTWSIILANTKPIEAAAGLVASTTTSASYSTPTSTEMDDPVISGTEIRIYRIAALLDGGMTVGQVMRDYPSLTRSQIEGAEEYARAYPNTGRQYPKRTLKDFLRRGPLGRLQQELSDGA